MFKLGQAAGLLAIQSKYCNQDAVPEKEDILKLVREKFSKEQATQASQPAPKPAEAPAAANTANPAAEPAKPATEQQHKRRLLWKTWCNHSPEAVQQDTW